MASEIPRSKFAHEGEQMSNLQRYATGFKVACVVGGVIVGGLAVAGQIQSGSDANSVRPVPAGSTESSMRYNSSSSIRPFISPGPLATSLYNSPTPEAHPRGSEGLADAAKKRRAAQIISTFENSTTEIQYAYAEDIGDGRGITAGRAGFTSGTSDLLMVVKEYTKAYPDNLLQKYLPALQHIEDAKEQGNIDGDTAGLDGFVVAWRQASESDGGKLNKVQDDMVDKLYFNPAIAQADAVGIRSALGQAVIWDTNIQHGSGNDPDGLPALIRETVNKYGKVSGQQEQLWLDGFLTIRYNHLQHAASPETRAAWRESVTRVDALRGLLKDNKLDLQPPLTWKVYGDEFRLDS